MLFPTLSGTACRKLEKVNFAVMRVPHRIYNKQNGEPDFSSGLAQALKLFICLESLFYKIK